MRIRTITCHNVDNHGADLQAYALMHYLEGLGHDVKIINYCPKYFNHYRPLLCDSPKYMGNIFIKLAYICAKFPGRTLSYLKYHISLRKKNFDKFRKKYYKMTEKYDDFEGLRNNPPKADLYIAGSDQIWNTMMNNGKDPAFFLEFVPKNERTSTYAASFSVSKIPKELKDITAERLSNIDYISVREKSAIRILEDLGIHNGTVVLDPVFLLDREEWQKIEDKHIFKDNYLLVYDFERSEDIKRNAIKYAKKHRLKIYSLYKNDYCDMYFEDYGPDVFLALIRDAKFVLSNSFHATAFSIIYQKEFFVIKRQEGINSRMQDLLESIGLIDRIGEKISNCSNIDYQKVNVEISKFIINSKNYIDMITK